MGEKLVVGPINRGLRNDVTAFNIDNDSFPTLINAYQWRGRIKRKRGTSLLNRLQRFFGTGNTAYGSINSIIVDGTGNANLITGFAIQSSSSIIPGSISIQDTNLVIYQDNVTPGVLTPNAAVASGTVNYATGAIVISASAGLLISSGFQYYPNLPVMGLEELNLRPTQNPGTLAFDTTNAYNIQTTVPYNIYNVSFYKNPSTGTYPGYVEKTAWTPISWNGQDYQQFWSVNYEGAFWTTNGMDVPFTLTNIGMQFAPSNTITFNARTATTITVTITNCPLVIGDFVFFNEWTAPTASDAQTLNFQTGYVTACAPNTPPLAAKVVTITFPNAAIANVVFVPGIIQYLTTRVETTRDCIRWYDGDPTNGNVSNPTFITPRGWVNFCPPLSRADFSIADLTADQYYLVGAKMIVPFKDRLLFLGPIIQTSSSDSQVYLQDTIIYSQNGTPFYTCSFTGDPSLATTVFTPILVPEKPSASSNEQTSTPSAFWEDQTGFGGFRSAGVNQPIITSSSNEDALIVGFTDLQTKLIYSGNDIQPFDFYIINSELGSGSTFSIINMDRGIITRGNRGFVATSQTEAQRIDLEIPDQVFQISLQNNGAERVTAQRDYINEWIYFTYPDNEVSYSFPNQTLQFNYRDNSWAIFNECYTTYGLFRKTTGYIWSNIGILYPTWSSWNDPWNAGTTTLFQPQVIAGNQQGFVLSRDDGTNEADSLYIEDFTNSVVTSPDHCLNNGDYIVISGAIGTISPEVNGNIFSVYDVTADTFTLNPNISTGTYLGGGVIKRMYVPFIQTKQFPSAWGIARKTRIGPQQYLFTTTENGQVTLLIFLSQNDENPYNNGVIVPAFGSVNNALIYSTTLFTCPESTNLGLTPANINLQIPTAINQLQTWHRMNTSLIGDSVQIGFTMSDIQMRDTTFSNQFSEIELHGFILDLNQSQMLV